MAPYLFRASLPPLRLARLDAGMLLSQCGIFTEHYSSLEFTGIRARDSERHCLGVAEHQAALLRTDAILKNPSPRTALAKPQTKSRHVVVKLNVVLLPFRKPDTPDAAEREFHGRRPRSGKHLGSTKRSAGFPLPRVGLRVCARFWPDSRGFCYPVPPASTDAEWLTQSSGLRMWIRIAPPTRASISHTGLVKPLGPHHRASRSASVHARNTVARGASNTRVMVTSRSASVLSRAATAMIYLQASPVKLLRHQNHPMHPELVGKHAEARREECLGERHRNLAALRQRRELLIGVRLIFGDDR